MGDTEPVARRVYVTGIVMLVLVGGGLLYTFLKPGGAGSHAARDRYRAWDGVYQVVSASEGCTSLRAVELRGPGGAPLKYFALRSPLGVAVHAFACTERPECAAFTGTSQTSVQFELDGLTPVLDSVLVSSTLAHGGAGALLSGSVDSVGFGDGGRCSMVHSIGTIGRSGGDIVLIREVRGAVVAAPGGRACSAAEPPAGGWPCLRRYEIHMAPP